MNDIDIINIEYNKIIIEFNNFVKIYLLPIIEKYNEPLKSNIYENDYENNDLKKSIIFLTKLSSTKNILHIGFNSGFTPLLYLISNPNIIVTSIDIVKYSYIIPCYLIIKEYFKNRINLIWGNSIEELKNIQNIQNIKNIKNKNKNKFDIININGSIHNDIITEDIKNSMLLLNNNAFLLLKKDINKLFNNNINNNLNEIININDKNFFLYQYINEDIINEEIVNEDILNEEIVNEDIINEDIINEEIVNEDILNEEIVNEEIVNKSKTKNILPRGSWIHSSQNYYVKDNNLYTELQLSNGSWNSTSIKISNIAYENNNGNLEPIKLYIYLEENDLFINLKIISSLFIISKYYGYILYIDYDSFNNLDNNNREILYNLFYNLLKKSCNNKYEKLNYNDYVKINNKNNFDLINEGRFFYLPDNNFSIINNKYNIIPEKMKVKNYIKEKIKFYKSLIYPNFLIDDINNFILKYNLSEYIGVYIENIENIYDNESQSYLKIYADKIFDLRKKNNKIIIFSENNEINDIFLEEKYIIYPNKCCNSIYQKLYEFILLSKTKLIISLDNSSFSFESAFLEGSNIELYINKKWILYKLK